MPTTDTDSSDKNKSSNITFRLTVEYLALLDSLAEKHNTKRIHVLKSALLAFSELEDEAKNPYLLKTIR